MIIFIYLLIAINVLLVEPSSIRNAYHQNEFAPYYYDSKDGLANKDENGLKIVSREPFIMELPVQQEGIEKPGRDEEKERKEKQMKKLLKKRYHNLKALRKKDRTKREADFTEEPRKETKNVGGMRKENQRRILIDPKKLGTTFWELQNKNFIPKSKQREIDYTKEPTSAEDKNDKKLYKEIIKHKKNLKPKNVQRRSHRTPIHKSAVPLASLIYPSTAKSNKNSVKYNEGDQTEDSEKAEEKINYMKRVLRMNNSDLSTESSRKSRKVESENAANKIAKMFLALSALNHGKHKSKLKGEGSKSWESDEEEQDENPIKSFNEERYKIKKWVEHLKSKRSSKPCTCNQEESEERDLFPLEKTLNRESDDDSLEECRRKIAGTKSSSLRKTFERFENQKNKNCKFDDDFDMIKALTTRGRRKLELPLEDLEIYRSRAKLILQNAEEILDKLKEQEEIKKYSNPTNLMNHVKELTSRIQGDPRNSENDLIKLIQKNMDWTPLLKPRNEDEEKDFSKSVKTYFVDPYEKARALTEESARKLSAYLLKNLALLNNDDKQKEKEELKFAEAKEELPQIYQGQDSWNKDELSMDDLKREKDEDKLNEEEGISQPKLNEPTASTTSQFELKNKNMQDSEQLVALEDPIQKKIEELIEEQNSQIKEVTEAAEKLEDIETLIATKNPENVEISIDWKSADSNNDNSEISNQNSKEGPEEYGKTEANSKNIDGGSLENREDLLEKNNEQNEPFENFEPNEKLFNLLNEEQLEKNKELTTKDSSDAEPITEIVSHTHDSDDLEVLSKSEVETKDDQMQIGTEKSPEIPETEAEMKTEMQSLELVDLMPKVEEGLEAKEIEDTPQDDLLNLQKVSDSLNVEEKMIKDDNKEYFEEKGSAETNEEKLESEDDRSDKQKQEEKVSAPLFNEMNKENSENTEDTVLEQQNNEEFSSEKQINQSSEEFKSDKSQDSNETILEKEHKNNEKDILLSEGEQNVKDDALLQLVSEEQSRNENDVLNSEHLKPKEEIETDQQNYSDHTESPSEEKEFLNSNIENQEKQTFETKEYFEDLVGDDKGKDSNSAEDSKENESESTEEPGKGKEIVEFPERSEDNVKMNSETNEKQDKNIFDQENIPTEYLISQNFQEEPLGSKDTAQHYGEQEEEPLGSKDTVQHYKEQEEETLGLQEVESNERISSQEATHNAKSTEEILESEGTRKGIEESKGELLNEQESETDSTEPRELLQEQKQLEDFDSKEYTSRETSQEKKDWPVDRSNHPETENILQSENQEKGSDDSEFEKSKGLDNDNQTENTPITNEFKEKILEQKGEARENTQLEEKLQKKFENESDEEVLKQNEEFLEREEIDDNQPSSKEESYAEERINDDGIMNSMETQDSVENKEKLLRKVDEEVKEMMTDKNKSMIESMEPKSKEWEEHPFEDKVSNDPLTGENSPLEYYDKEESQTSQFVEKASEQNGPPEEENLQEINPKPKMKDFKIPQEIEKIMKDLNEGKEKEEIHSIQNLDPENIDKFIDKIDEAKKEEEEDTDCKKECACADEIELRSRKTGRYEIVKDFLRWVKDLKVNRVLSDD